MRRLLQFATLLLMLATFLAPLAECFDRWDPPGLGNDTEFGVFALIFILCLLLLVSKRIASLARLIGLTRSFCPPPGGPSHSLWLQHIARSITPHPSPPPLRI